MEIDLVYNRASEDSSPSLGTRYLAAMLSKGTKGNRVYR